MKNILHVTQLRKGISDCFTSSHLFKDVQSYEVDGITAIITTQEMVIVRIDNVVRVDFQVNMDN